MRRIFNFFSVFGNRMKHALSCFDILQSGSFSLLKNSTSENGNSLLTLVPTLFHSVDRKPDVFVARSAEESALQGHVIDTVHAWDDFSCAFSCLHTKNCFSFNFKEKSHVCELNHSNKLTSPQDLVLDLDSSYYELMFS